MIDLPGHPPPNYLQSDSATCRDLGVTQRTLYTWDRDPEMLALGWPAPIVIRKRKYRPVRSLRRFYKYLQRREGKPK